MRALVVDTALRDFAGHHAEYDGALVEELGRRGVGATILCHRDASPEVLARLPCLPVFPRSEYEDASPLPFRLPFADFAFGALAARRALRGAPVRPEGTLLVLAHTVVPKHLAGILAWAGPFLSGSDAPLAVLLRFDVKDRVDEAAWRLAFRAGRLLGPRRVAWLTDSEPLAGRFAPLAGAPVTVVPIPHVPPAGGPPRERGEVPVVAVPGIAGENKGFHLLPGAVELLRERRVAVRFRVQSYTPRPTAAVAAARERLRALAPAVELLEEPLPPAEYLALLSGSDAVLASYDPACYRGQTSGVLTEAVALGRPVLATRTEWMEGCLTGYDTGLFVEEFSAQGIAAAVERFAGSRDLHEERARRAAPAWRERHNPRAFVDALLRACSLPSAEGTPLPGKDRP